MSKVDNSQNYYAVGGLGIFRDWKEAKPFCYDKADDRPIREAKFKKFGNKEDAEQFLKDNQIQATTEKLFFAYVSPSDRGLCGNFEALKCVLEGHLGNSTYGIDFVQRSSYLSAAQWLIRQPPKSGHEPSNHVENGVKVPQTTTQPSRKRLRADSDVSDKAINGSSTGAVLKTIIVYTDGACTNNGKLGAQAGYGVFFGHGDPRNESAPLPGVVDSKNQTNQRAELFAIKRALEICQFEQNIKVLVRTDSKYSIQCLTEWLPKWRTNQFKTAAGSPVKNLDIIEAIDKLIMERGGFGGGRIGLEYVAGHSNDIGNDAADKLAREGAAKTRRGITSSVSF